MKLLKVNHVVLGLKVAANGGGFTQEELDEMINRRLSEGYDDVEVFPVRTLFNTDGVPTDYVQLYIFKKYEDAPTAKSKKE